MSDERTVYKLRVLMADVEALMAFGASDPAILSKTGYILEADLPTNFQDNAVFVGTIPVPTLLEVFGAAASGPVGFAFLVKEGLATVKRYFVSLAVGVPWALPKNIWVNPLGVTTMNGAIYGHFELTAWRPEDMEEFLARVREEAQATGVNLLTLKAKDYTPDHMRDLLATLAKNMRGAHGTR